MTITPANAQWLDAMLKRFPVSKNEKTGNYRSCPVRLSFPHLFVPKPDEQGELKYSVTLLFPPKADMSLLKTAANEAAIEKFGNPPKVKVHSPFHDAQEKAHLEGYAEGWRYITVSNKSKPDVVDNFGKPIDPVAIYPGCWGLVTMRRYSYDNQKRKGVSFGLQNVQKIGDDVPLGGGKPAASDEFEILGNDADASVATVF